MTFRDFLDRYGITLGVVLAITMVLVLLPGNAERRTASEISDAGSTGLASALDSAADTAAAGTQNAAGTTGGAGGTGVSTVTGIAPAPKTDAGTVAAPVTGILAGQGPCRSPDGRMAGIARYMPPCIKFVGENGGATHRGVTKDKVKVVRFVSQADPATQAILQGAKLADDPAVVSRVYKALFRYGNTHYETFGREVEYVEYNASGPDANDEAMKADAVKIANEVKAFAVLGGPKVLGQELAQRGVICICTVSLTSQFYRENPPYMFGTLPTITEYAQHIAEYVGKRLANKPAKWAGDELNPVQQFRDKPRKFGLIYIEGANGRVDPEGKRARDYLVAELAKYGVRLSAEVAYLYDPGRNQQDVTNMIATMRAAGVTTILPIVDPLYPILITQEATRQQYFPEWFITGTGLSDTTAAGRLYDGSQWRHAFGVSPLWVTWTAVSLSEGFREFHHGMPGMRPGDEGVLVNVYRAGPQQLFIGLQMAGPKLTADAFAQGQFAYPPTGGLPAAPLNFVTREYPTQIKDFTEIWWGANEQGKDERDESGTGMMMKVDGGKRYKAGAWPAIEPKAFVRDGAIAVSSDVALGGPLPHEQDGHKHVATQKCLSCR